MKIFLLIAITAVTLGAQQFKDVEYFQRTEGKDKAEKIDGNLIFDKTGNSIQFAHKNNSLLKVPAAAIKNVVYERAAKPRYAAGLLLAWPLLFTKSKSHFLTVQYTDEKGVGQYVVFRLSKGNYREVLAAAEAFTGKPVQKSEER
ncbi:MAG: hypothetical protein IT165_32040 [Bryobacterales bacterium]|nr:hypothetical protein [Bryobacterales bacterium]